MIQLASVPAASTRKAPSVRELERVGDEIAALAAHLHAATHRLLMLIAEFDGLFERAGGGTGFRCTADWLSWRTGLGPGAAREKVRVARALVDLPRISEAMSRGRLSYSTVRALTRVARPENEGELLGVALYATAAQVERIVRAWRRVDRLEGEGRRHESRHLSVVADEDGSYVVRGRLDPEVGAVLVRALEAAEDELYRRERRSREERAASGEDAPTARQRRADALGLLAECALVGGLGGDGTRKPGTEGERIQAPCDRHGEACRVEAARDAERDHDEEAGRVDAGRAAEEGERVDVPRESGRDGDDAGGQKGATIRDGARRGRTEEGRHSTRLAVSGLRAGRFQVVVHVDAETLREGSATGQSVLEGGVGVPAETSRRLACDAARVVMTHSADGSVLDVGRRTRTVPPAIRRALDARDRGCRFPGCGLRFCEAHHITHWADGGATRLENLVLLCRAHHRAVHEGRFRVMFTRAGDVRFHRPDGRTNPEVPPAPPVPDAPVAVLERAHRERGIEIDPWTPTPRWLGERLDLGLTIQSLRKPSAGRSRGNASVEAAPASTHSQGRPRAAAPRSGRPDPLRAVPLQAHRAPVARRIRYTEV